MVGESDSPALPYFRAQTNAFDPAFEGEGQVMKLIEPTFDVGGELWPALSADPGADLRVLEHKLAKQSAELNLRVIEIVELYNTQQQQANELQNAYDEIDRLNRIIVTLHVTTEQHKADIAAAQNKTAIVENEKEAWRAERDSAIRESKALAERLQSMEAAFNVKQSNVAAALEQVEFLNSEVVSASAERFKLVAAAQGEKRRHRTALNQQTLALEDKIKRAEALTATQATQIKHLEEIRTKLDKRVEVLETLLKSEREIAERKITRLSEQLSAERPADSVVGER